MRRLLLVSCLLLCPVAAFADPLYVTLHSERQKYFLGENVLVDFVVTNTGRQPVKIDVGGDYRGAPRALRFKVDAFNAAGREVADPHPSPPCFGGLSTSPSLKPGESFTMTVPIGWYRRFDTAGHYRVHVTHDLGQKQPVGAWIELTLERPNPAQAAAVVKWTAGTQTYDAVMGKRTLPYGDFELLSYPEYVAPLLALGTKDALHGLATIPTPDAAEAILQLSEHAELALDAAQALNMRLPDPQWQGDLSGRNPFEVGWTAERQRLNRLGWQPNLTQRARSLAARLLQRPEVPARQAGAFIVECIGSAQDLPAVMAALDSSLSAPPETDVYPRPRGATMELDRAVHMLLSRGADAPASPRTPAELAVALMQAPSPALIQQGLHASAAWVRLKATQAAPETSGMLLDPDPDVQVAAINRIAPGHEGALLQVLRTTKDEWVLRAAVSHLGIKSRPVLIDRLTDTGHWLLIYTQLLDITMQQVPGYSVNGTPSAQELQALQSAWRAFHPGGVVKHLPAPLIPRELSFTP